jgi:hypothetical protein
VGERVHGRVVGVRGEEVVDDDLERVVRRLELREPRAAVRRDGGDLLLERSQLVAVRRRREPGLEVLELGRGLEGRGRLRGRVLELRPREP